MDFGWKPMPVILKVIWVMLLIGAIFSIFSVIGAFDAGFDLPGIHLERMMAVNVAFVMNMVLPVLLLIAMFRRHRGTVAFAVIYFLFFVVNSLFVLQQIDAKIEMVLSQMPEMGEELSDEYMYLMARYTIIFTALFSAAFNLAILIIFLVKRNYFLNREHDTNGSKPELPS
jgi:hypothetical protein